MTTVWVLAVHQCQLMVSFISDGLFFMFIYGEILLFFCFYLMCMYSFAGVHYVVLFCCMLLVTACVKYETVCLSSTSVCFCFKLFFFCPEGDSLAILRAELKSQKKHVKNLKKKSLWSKILEEVAIPDSVLLYGF